MSDQRRRVASKLASEEPSSSADDTGDLAIVADHAVEAGLMMRRAESDRAVLLSSVVATLLMVAAFWQHAHPVLMSVFVALRALATLANHQVSRTVLRLGSHEAHRRGYLSRLEAATALTALSWGFTTVFFEAPVLQRSATVLGLLALVAVQAVTLLVSTFSRRALVLLVTIMWLCVVLRVASLHDDQALTIIGAALLYQAVLLRFGFVLHRQMAASVRSNLVNEVLLHRVSALHARMRAQRDELAALNAQLTAALDLSIELASHDSLTGTLNRRAFQDRLSTDRRALRIGTEPASLLLIDFDFFKHVNDNHGHTAGDAVLAECARVLRAEMRPMDVFARWGGEEFIALLPCTTLDDAERVAERLRRVINDATHPTWPPGLSVTASIGVASLDSDSAFDSCLAAADHALYLAKAEGRNAVRVAARLP